MAESRDFCFYYSSLEDPEPLAVVSIVTALHQKIPLVDMKRKVEGGLKPIKKDFDIAVLEGRLDIMKYFISVDEEECKPTTNHLDCAIKSGYFDIVRFLVVEGQCKPTSEHLNIAVSQGYSDIVRFLVVEGECKPTSEHLNIAVSQGYSDIVRFLVVEGECKPITKHLDTTIQKEDYDTLRFLVTTGGCEPTYEHLELAIWRGYFDIMKCLVVEGKLKPTIKHLNTAILKKNIGTIKFLVFNGGCKPTNDNLDIAVLKGYVDIVKFLVVNGECKPTIEHLDMAIRKEHPDIVKYLVIKCGCRPTTGHLNTLFSKAYTVYDQKVEIFKCLVFDGGGKPTTEHLNIAIKSRYFDIVKLLIVACGCKPTSEHLDIAIQKEYYDIVEFLLFKGTCQPTIEHLHAALMRRQCDIIKLLITKGKCRPTAEHLNFAINGECLDIVKCLILDGGCSPTTEHLDIPIMRKYVNIVNFLVVEGGCKPTAEHLYFTIKEGYIDIVKCLVIKGGCKPTAKHLDIAVKRDHLNIVTFLVIEERCKPTAEHLQTAINGGYTDTVKLLATDYECRPTAQHLLTATEKGYVDIVTLLVVDGGCKPTTEHLDSALHTEWYNNEIVKCLVLDGRCKPTAEHLTIAIQKGYSDTVKFLVVIGGCKPTTEHLTTAIQRHCYNIHIVKFLVVEGGCKPITEHLKIPVKKGHTDIVECLVVDGGCRPTADQLHTAIQEEYDKIAHILIDSQRIDLEAQVDPQQCNALHLACAIGHLGITEHLIKDGRCSIAQKDKEDNTALHFACYHGHYRIAKVLLNTGKCDVNVRNMSNSAPLDLTDNPEIIRELIKYGANPSDVYKRFGNVLGNAPLKPIEAPVKVFITGDPRGGKSTLTKSLQKETLSLVRLFLGVKKVSDVDEKTAGIIPYQFISKHYGSVTFFDLAGQREFYSSHSAVLCNTISSSPPIFLLVIDLQRSEEELKQSILYWLCFLENQCSSVSSKPHLIIIGSHADILKSKGEDPEHKGSIVNTVVNQLKSTWFVFSGFIPMDCQYPQSSQIDRLRLQLGISCKALRVTSTIQFNCHCFLVYLVDKFSACPAVTLQQVQDSMLACSDTNSPINFVPLNIEVMLKLSEQLNDRGHILFLKNLTKTEDSWIIINKAALLSEVTGTVFAPEGFKQHCQLASSTGVVPLSEIVNHFPNHNSDMLISFFTHLEFCSEICDQETLKLIEKHQSLSRDNCRAIAATDSHTYSAGEADCSSSSGAQSTRPYIDHYFLFPGLITIDSPDQVWETSSQLSFQCGWMLQCSQPNQFFTSRFLQVLLLRIAFAFALIPHRQELDPSVPALQRKCSIWRNGVFWGDRNGIEVLVEVVEHKSVIVFMQSQHLTGECVCLRSSIINKVLKTASDICPFVSTSESFIKPTDIQYPIDSASELTCFSIAEVALSVNEAKTAVVTTSGKLLLLESLLTYEPYAMLSSPFLHRLFDMASSEEEVTDDFLMDFARACCNKRASHNLVMLLECLKVNEGDFQFHIDQEPREYRENSVHRCFLLLKTWKDQTAYPTLQALRRVLDQHSVFGGRNPLELHRSLKEESILIEKIQQVVVVEEEEEEEDQRESEVEQINQQEETKQSAVDSCKREEPQQTQNSVSSKKEDCEVLETDANFQYPINQYQSLSMLLDNLHFDGNVVDDDGRGEERGAESRIGRVGEGGGARGERGGERGGERNEGIRGRIEGGGGGIEEEREVGGQRGGGGEGGGERGVGNEVRERIEGESGGKRVGGGEKGGRTGRRGEWKMGQSDEGRNTEKKEVENRKRHQQGRENPQTQQSHYQEICDSSAQGRKLWESFCSSVIETSPHTQERKGLHAKALYGYQAACDDDVSFDADDIIENIEQVFEEWWMGEVNGKRGLFPSSHVELI